MTKDFVPVDILNFAIEIERNGYEFYTETAKKFKDLKTVKLFHYLAEQELRHERCFKQMKRKSPTFTPTETLEAAYEIYKQEFLATYMFSDSAQTQGRIKLVASVEEAVNLAVGFEKDTVVLYSSIKKYIDEENKKLIDEVIDEELGHIVRLLELKKDYNVELNRGENY
jgi:rubrerythrin